MNNEYIYRAITWREWLNKHYNYSCPTSDEDIWIYYNIIPLDPFELVAPSPLNNTIKININWLNMPYKNKKGKYIFKKVKKILNWILESDEDEPDPMFKLVVCPYCGEKANNTYKFCPYCGEKTSGKVENNE